MRYLALLLLFPAIALGGTVTVTWTPPESPVESYNIVMTQNGQTMPEIEVAGTEESYIIQDVGAGNYSLYMTSEIGAEVSGPSNVVAFVIEEQPADPKPPSITIQFNGFVQDGLEVK